MVLNLYNTLSRKIEEFKPLKKGKVTMYSCGPTVYNFAHIGNLRTFLLNDFIKRILTYNDLEVKHVMNATDVDDKTIKASQKEGIPLSQLTEKYIQYFKEDTSALNILPPSKFTKATTYISQMIELIQKLLDKKVAYVTTDGVYFDIKKDKNYGKLAQLEKVKRTKERISLDSYDKSSVQDFALWKFYTPTDGEVYWNAPFGKGRPGWHIECSAMSMDNLGPTIDIHTGAIDLMFPHHTNEIAQSECATGKTFVRYWVHGGFLNMSGEKMSKSIGNISTLRELINEGYSPIQFRYFCLLTHYRKPLNFSYENLDAAKTAFIRLERKIIEMKKTMHKGNKEVKSYEIDFLDSINDDLNLPKAVQVLIKLIEDTDLDSKIRLGLAEKFDKVLGLNIKEMKEKLVKVSDEIHAIVVLREQFRKDKKWADADLLRARLKELGFEIKDSPSGPELEKIQ